MDGDLRELEKAVERSGDASARLRLGSALVRAGRVDDAFDALLPGVEDDEVRAALVARREWSGCDNGYTSYADVGPVLAPTQAWRTRLPSKGNLSFLRATPLGVFVEDPDTSSIRRLDLSTGAVRSSIEGCFLRVAGARGVVQEDRAASYRASDLAVVDLWTGRVEKRFEFDAFREIGSDFVLRPGSRRTRAGESDYLEGFDLREVSSASKRLWRVPWRESDREVWFIAVGENLVVYEHGRVSLLRRSDGVVLRSWELPTYRVDRHRTESADERGFLAQLPNGWFAMSDGLAGASIEVSGRPLGLAPGFVLASDAAELVAIDRASGAIVRRFGVSLGIEPVVSLVRDVIYVVDAESALHAITTAGQRLWTLTRDQIGGQVQELVALPRRLFAVVGAREVVCFTDETPTR